METVTIITAVISGLCVAVPNVIANITSNNKARAITDLKIEELTKKVNQHNNLIDRMYKAEDNINIINEKLNDLSRRGK